MRQRQSYKNPPIETDGRTLTVKLCKIPRDEPHYTLMCADWITCASEKSLNTFLSQSKRISTFGLRKRVSSNSWRRRSNKSVLTPTISRSAFVRSLDYETERPSQYRGNSQWRFILTEASGMPLRTAPKKRPNGSAYRDRVLGNSSTAESANSPLTSWRTWPPGLG